MNTSKPFDWKSPLPNTVEELERWVKESNDDLMRGASSVYRVPSEQAEKWKKLADAEEKLKDLRQMLHVPDDDGYLLGLLDGPMFHNWTSLTGLVANIIVGIRARGMKPLPEGFGERLLERLVVFDHLRVQGRILLPGGGVFSKEDAVPTLEDAIKAVGGGQSLDPNDLKPVEVGHGGMAKKDPACTLHGPEKQCCCNCKHHLPVHNHCYIDPGVNRCVCDDRKGWACVPPGLGRVHDNWPEHDHGCEMYEAKQEDGK